MIGVGAGSAIRTRMGVVAVAPNRLPASPSKSAQGSSVESAAAPPAGARTLSPTGPTRLRTRTPASRPGEWARATVTATGLLVPPASGSGEGGGAGIPASAGRSPAINVNPTAPTAVHCTQPGLLLTCHPIMVVSPSVLR